jgi:hypothetical protein
VTGHDLEVHRDADGDRPRAIGDLGAMEEELLAVR